MNKAKDFWAPRKHGFDDDGPVAYAPRQRTMRPNGRPEGFGDEASPPGDLSPSQPTVDAVVKWYKDDKGFGFVELADGQGDAFLHATVLHSAGTTACCRERRCAWLSPWASRARRCPACLDRLVDRGRASAPLF